MIVASLSIKRHTYLWLPIRCIHSLQFAFNLKVVYINEWLTKKSFTRICLAWKWNTQNNRTRVKQNGILLKCTFDIALVWYKKIRLTFFRFCLVFHSDVRGNEYGNSILVPIRCYFDVFWYFISLLLWCLTNKSEAFILSHSNRNGLNFVRNRNEQSQSVVKHKCSNLSSTDDKMFAHKRLCTNLKHDITNSMTFSYLYITIFRTLANQFITMNSFIGLNVHTQIAFNSLSMINKLQQTLYSTHWYWFVLFHRTGCTVFW